jgi:hypothetical protein
LLGHQNPPLGFIWTQLCALLCGQRDGSANRSSRGSPNGNGLAPVALLLEIYSRWPRGKHECLELVAARGTALPDTPVMAVHRGRIDLLEAHFARDPNLLTRTFSHEEIYPPELGCGPDHSFALHGTPLAGTTLLHVCVDFDEIEIARWLIEHSMDVNKKPTSMVTASADTRRCLVAWSRSPTAADGRGMPPSPGCCSTTGANRNARASLRKQLRFVRDDSMHEYRDVTPLSWGERFHDQDWVNRAAMRLIAERGGRL